ncbi:MAG TPA: hypothetical protein P5318_09700 [Candidatus Hydrogenedentes bacterium]|nr:hypothetical protein [Candidatus Hydrogenedentota bacterium]
MNEPACEKYQDSLLGLIENALEPSAEADLREHLDRCPACADEYRWLRAACADLEALGDEWRRQAPPVDLLDGVMEMVGRIKEVRPRPIHAAPAPLPHRFHWIRWGGLAGALAAALLLVWATVFSPDGPSAPGPQAGSESDRRHAMDTNRPARLAAKTPSRSSQIAMADLQKILDPMRTPSSQDTEDKPSASPKMEEAKTPSLHELLELRKQAIDSPDARTRLSLWATLADAAARELAKDAGVPIDAKVGLAGLLPPNEAESVLLAAIESFPDDPYLRKELAEIYSTQPGGEAKALAQWQELSRLDPDNAYASFKIASNMFTQGDVDAARLALEHARALERLDAYTRNAAKYYERALEAAGTESGAAAAAAALSAGTSEYAHLLELGNELLQTGRNIEQQGDGDLALFIYDTVQNLGAMAVRNALFSAEWLAGLDIQSAAITMEGETAAAQSSPDTLADLARQMQDLVASYNELAAYYRSIDAFFSGDITDALFLLFANLILQNGDLNVLQLLPRQ